MQIQNKAKFLKCDKYSYEFIFPYRFLVSPLKRNQFKITLEATRYHSTLSCIYWNDSYESFVMRIS